MNVIYTQRIMYVLQWQTVSALTKRLFRNSGNNHKNNTRVSAETVPRESTYIILFLARRKESINDFIRGDIHGRSCKKMHYYDFVSILVCVHTSPMSKYHTDINLMKQFDHNRYLPCWQYTEACSHISSYNT